jgi:hypothetical protein
MSNKIKSTGSVTTLFFFGAVLIFLLNGGSTPDLPFETQHKLVPKESSAINTTDSFRCGTMDVYYKMIKEDPNFVRRQRELEIFTKDYIKKINPGDRTVLGGHDIWDRDKYLNIWICNLYFTGGYATFPGGNAANDGVVIKYTIFGTIGAVVPGMTKGRIATHEIGHWINLRHIWGDSYCGDDFVDDTPTQQAANGGCLTFPHVTCNNGPNGDMFMNYMDYTSDSCKNIYTIGQSARMNAAINSYRVSLLTSNGGVPVNGVPITHFRSDKTTINPGQSINFFDESGGIPTGWQ